MKLAVVNVGVNSNDARKHQLRSPIFPDGSFEFVTILESARFQNVTTIPNYGDLPSWTGRRRGLADFLPESLRGERTHHDPDFEHLTYGDVQSARGASLKQAVPGDQLWFLARLWESDGTALLGPSRFYFVGYLEVEANLFFENGQGEYPPTLRTRLQANAHWLRCDAGDPGTFRVLVGKLDASRRFQTAVEVTPDIAAHLFASNYNEQTDGFVQASEVSRNKNGKPRLWRHFGSITRAVQWFLDSNVPDHQAHLEALASIARAAGCATLPAAIT